MNKILIAIGSFALVVAAVVTALTWETKAESTGDTEKSEDAPVSEEKSDLEALNDPVGDMLSLQDAAYRTARTNLLADPNVQTEIDNFSPTTNEGKMLKAALQGWVDHPTDYADVVPRMLEMEESGRNATGDSHYDASGAANTRHGEYYEGWILDSLMSDYDDYIMLLPRMMELLVFEPDNMDVETSLLPPPHSFWRYRTLEHIAEIAMSRARTSNVAASVIAYHEDVFAVLLEKWREPILDSQGNVDLDRISGLEGSFMHYGNESHLDELRTRWEDTSLPHDWRVHFYHTWVSVRRYFVNHASVDPANHPLPADDWWK